MEVLVTSILMAFVKFYPFLFRPRSEMSRSVNDLLEGRLTDEWYRFLLGRTLVLAGLLAVWQIAA